MAKDAHCINTSSYNTIIPFSSGISSSQMEFQFTIDSIETASILGFGTANNSVPIVDNKIDLTGTTSEAFTVPYDGNITAISASFSPLATFPDVPGPLTIRSQIFHAAAGSNIFTGTSAIVDLTPALTLPINSGGQIAFGSRDISPFSISVGDGLIIALYISSFTPGLFIIIEGNASAGINIVNKK